MRFCQLWNILDSYHRFPDNIYYLIKGRDRCVSVRLKHSKETVRSKFGVAFYHKWDLHTFVLASQYNYATSTASKYCSYSVQHNCQHAASSVFLWHQEFQENGWWLHLHPFQDYDPHLSNQLKWQGFTRNSKNTTFSSWLKLGWTRLLRVGGISDILCIIKTVEHYSCVWCCVTLTIHFPLFLSFFWLHFVILSLMFCSSKVSPSGFKFFQFSSDKLADWRIRVAFVWHSKQRSEAGFIVKGGAEAQSTRNQTWPMMPSLNLFNMLAHTACKPHSLSS